MLRLEFNRSERLFVEKLDLEFNGSESKTETYIFTPSLQPRFLKIYPLLTYSQFSRT